jgi:thiol:disulfide interchange protein DsbC
MKQFLLFLTLCVTLFAKDVDPKIFKSVPMLAQQHITITRAYDHGIIYELSLEINTPRGVQHTSAFLTKDKKVVLLGDAMNAKTGESIKRPIDMENIRQSADVIFGSGPDEYIVFTDPECPYCVKFERIWPSIEKKVKLYVFFMPLSNHQNATQMSYHVMKQESNEAKIRALLSMANGNRRYEKLTMTQQIHDLFGKKISENQLLANEFGARGTPAVFDMKGNSISWPSLGK